MTVTVTPLYRCEYYKVPIQLLHNSIFKIDLELYMKVILKYLKFFVKKNQKTYYSWNQRKILVQIIFFLFQKKPKKIDYFFFEKPKKMGFGFET